MHQNFCSCAFQITKKKYSITINLVYIEKINGNIVKLSIGLIIY